MNHGNVKWFDSRRGIGAIEPHEGDDVIVELDSLRRSGIESLKEGQLVAFDMAWRAGRSLAEDVKVL
ncbi:cold-shock protein [Polymorphum gilvum]|uniref:Cold-shock DNA-binding domain protein n=1 Tax=Polymorphum gilvum (strain LMG 25793 / CGMCC 1.9160 / SL003B-26A1) TaxID=991905 RepID=F2J3K6_POLGS|nr:cold shock domain-containing protein [Polymorphum gilvum]ADZ72142.1 Cold-shock DNA-binding domain protein [Polymorphum gilvum SL003B-26A1]